jgi:hypothetical protein
MENHYIRKEGRVVYRLGELQKRIGKGINYRVPMYAMIQVVDIAFNDIWYDWLFEYRPFLTNRSEVDLHTMSNVSR